MLEKKSSATLSTLDRTFDFLEILAHRREPMSAAEISQAMGITKATTYSMLNSLLRKRYVERVGSSGYRLGSIFYKYGQLYLSNISLFRSPAIRSLINDILVALSKKWGCNAHLFYCTEGGELISPEGIDMGAGFFTIQMFLSTALPHESAGGRVFLAHMPEAKLIQYLSKTELKSTFPHSITDRDALMAELALIRKNGYAVARRSLNHDLSCVAAPIYDDCNKCILTLSLSFFGKEQSLIDSHLDELAADAKEASLQISSQYGYNPYRR